MNSEILSAKVARVARESTVIGPHAWMNARVLHQARQGWRPDVGTTRTRFFLLRLAKLGMVLAVSFYLAELISSHRAANPIILFDWEHDIPFWPAFYLPYFGIMALLPVILASSSLSQRQLSGCFDQMTVVVAVSFVIFLVIPTKQIPISEFTDNPAWRLLDAVTGQHNLFTIIARGTYNDNYHLCVSILWLFGKTAVNSFILCSLFGHSIHTKTLCHGCYSRCFNCGCGVNVQPAPPA